MLPAVDLTFVKYNGTISSIALIKHVKKMRGLTYDSIINVLFSYVLEKPT